MNIVILDGYTLNSGDISWDAFRALGNLRIFDRTGPIDLIDRCSNSEIVLTNKVVLSAGTIKKLAKLQYIGVLATGFNVVAVEAAKELGIVVTNVPAYGTHSVAQHTFALILEIFNNVGGHNTDIHHGGWNQISDFSYTLTTLHELSGKTLGVLGWGEIGKKVAEIGKVFDMHVIIHSSYPEAGSLFEFVSLEDLFRKSDIVSIHTKLTNHKIGLVNNTLFRLMKKEAVLINTSRGQIINEQDLADALNNDVIIAAGIDVFTVEPPSPDAPLLTAKNCILTPHISWATKEARERLMQIAADNIRAFIAGNPVNQVS